MKKYIKFGKPTLYIAILSLVIQSLAGVAPVLAADTGFRPPSAVVSNTGWTNPTAVYTSNGSRATANDTDDVIHYGSFNFGVPAGATIEGIEVSVEGYRTGLMMDRQAKITLSGDSGSSWSSSKTTNLPYSMMGLQESATNYGSNTDLWGKTSWAYSEFSNDNFRLKLDATTALWDLKIDYLAAKVYYTPNTAPSPAPEASNTFDGISTNDPYSLPFSWTGSIDADGDLVNYDFQVSTSPTDFETPARIMDIGTSATSYMIPVSTLIIDGVYYWRVSAYDAYSNQSSWSDVRSFTVDTVAPVITILPDNPATITYGDTYVDGGATASDNVDGDLTSSITDDSDVVVDNMKADDYVVTYTVTDKAGNTATATREVVVAKKKIKVIANNVSKFVGSIDPVLTYTYTGTLVGTDTFTGSIARVAGETPNLYLIDKGSLALNDNYDIEFSTGVFTISAVPVIPAFTTPINTGNGEAGEVLGAQTTDETKKDTDVKGTSDTNDVDDEKSDKNFWDSTWLGVRNWFWLLLAAAAIGGGAWWLLGIRRRDE